jgi:uncharacterized protein
MAEGSVSESGGKLDLSVGKFSHAAVASTLSRRMQEFIILPTEKCNFRCTYCYEDFAIGKMKPAVQSALERLMDRRIPELSRLSLSWFGGEPLVAKDVVLRLSKHASLQCRANGVTFSGGLTTNAYLLEPSLFEELVSYDQNFYQITLDGWGEEHDVVRRLANGKGTFERIWENLQYIGRSPEHFRIQLRIHVRRNNFHSVELLLKNIARTFGNDPRFYLDFEHLRDLGGEGGKSIEHPLSLSEMRDAEKEFRRIYVAHLAPEPQPVASSPMSQAEPVVDSAPPICYAARANSLLIRADGRIGKCTVALTDDRNTIGSIRPDGSLSIDSDRLRPWLRGIGDREERALECPLVGLPEVARANDLQTTS